jgi:hypothetical protein
MSIEKLPRSQRRRFWFPLLAVLLGLAPFVLLETGLRLLDVADPRQTLDPLAGFGRNTPLFGIHENEGVYRTLRAREPYFGRQSFPVVKADGTRRIFCLGGSTVRGRPYEVDTSFCRWLALELSRRDPVHRYRSINCGGISYASYRLLPVLTEVLRYAPDLIVLATGHNEFLEDRTYARLKSLSEWQGRFADLLFSLHIVTLGRRLMEPAAKRLLPAEVTARLDRQYGYASYRRDDAWRAEVIGRFAGAVELMLERSRDAGVPVVVVGLGANLRDTPPFKAEHRPGLTAEEQRHWRQAFETGSSLQIDAPIEALDAYRKAWDIDSEHALLNYRMARILDRIGDAPRAKALYRTAKEWDVCPLRMLEPMYTDLQRIAARFGVPFVDMRARIEAVALEGIPGNDLFVDHVHPAPSTHQLIARAIADELARSGWYSAGRDFGDAGRHSAYSAAMQALPDYYFSAARLRLGRLERWARRKELYRDTLPVDNAGRLRLAAKWLALKDTKHALEELRRALAREPKSLAAIGQRLRVLANAGRDRYAGEVAAAVLETLAAGEADSASLAALQDMATGSNVPDSHGK